MRELSEEVTDRDIATILARINSAEDELLRQSTPPEQIRRDLQDNAERQLLDELNIEQREIAEELLNYGEQYRQYRIQGGDDNVNLPLPVAPYLLIQGGPGTGKTHTMNVVDRILRIRARLQANVAMQVENQAGSVYQSTGSMMAVAPTGVAASHLRGGRTVHNLLVIRQRSSSNRNEMQQRRIDDTRRRILKKRLESAVFILVDEVSMLSPAFLSKIDARLKEMFADNLKRRNLAFGGVCLVLQGDFSNFRQL